MKSWVDNSNLPVLLMKYEDMWTNPFETFKKALKFVYNKVDENKLTKAIKESSFEKIKEQEKQHGFKEKSAKSKEFFRNGKSGSWKQELSSKQVGKICEYHGAVMDRFGYLTKKIK